MRMSLEGYSLQPPSLSGGEEKPLGVPSNTAELLFCKEPRALGRICAARQWRGMTNRQDGAVSNRSSPTQEWSLFPTQHPKSPVSSTLQGQLTH